VLGIVIGYVAGKPLGIGGASWLSTRLNRDVPILDERDRGVLGAAKVVSLRIHRNRSRTAGMRPVRR
jgi:hypothetical protein